MSRTHIWAATGTFGQESWVMQSVPRRGQQRAEGHGAIELDVSEMGRCVVPVRVRSGAGRGAFAWACCWAAAGLPLGGRLTC
ncbi:hypothetical protein JX265_004454 [Neoarthrinium moseri]|uniref:Uncharacterized protein n=1 Tax=Neoarthrinium moseri TaxID=1658444 RepID=A0A9P9WR60_9PEZI|nr:hypothetical protein JX265_004454 [Neoarthrinium moseri]